MAFSYEEKIANLQNYDLHSLAEIAHSCLPLQYQQEPWKICNHGVGVYVHENQLNAYLASYTDKHFKKLIMLYQEIKNTVLTMPFCIVDWGCGQGIATLTLIQCMNEWNIPLSNIQHISLIEPSEIAMKRAKLHIECVYPEVKRKGFLHYKSFETFDEKTFTTPQDFPVLHMFSNVLDMRSINVGSIAKKVLYLKNPAYILITSPTNSHAELQINNFISQLPVKKIIFSYIKTATAKNFPGDFTCYSKVIELSQNKTDISYNEKEFHKNTIILNIISKFEQINKNIKVFNKPFLHGYVPDLLIIHEKLGGILFNISYAQNQEELLKSIDNLQICKNKLFEINSVLHDQKLKNQSAYNKISTCLYCVNMTKSDIASFTSKKKKFTKCIGNDELSTQNIAEIYRENVFRNNNQVSQNICNEFLSFLCQQYHLKEEANFHYTLNKTQKLLSISIPGNKKIKGVAGSGKTLVLLYRAVNACIRTNAPVLILTFNLTLCNSLRKRLENIPENFDMNLIKITSYHQFIKNNTDQDIKYSAIFIDEAQDYEKEWIMNLRTDYAAQDSEFVIFADEKQNIYSNVLDTDKMPRTPIAGPWDKKLKTMYRSSNNLGELLMEFQRQFFKNKYDTDIIEKNVQATLFNDFFYCYQETLNYSRVVDFMLDIIKKENLHFHDCSILAPRINSLMKAEQILRNTYQINTSTTFETLEERELIIKKSDNSYPAETLSNDASFLELTEHNTILNDKEKFYAANIESLRHSKKINFSIHEGSLTLSTIHSFKGWETKLVFLLLDVPNNFLPPELVYTGLSRSQGRCYIISNCKEYHHFFTQSQEVTCIEM